MHRENCMCETCFQLQTVVATAAEGVKDPAQYATGGYTSSPAEPVSLAQEHATPLYQLKIPRPDSPFRQNMEGYVSGFAAGVHTIGHGITLDFRSGPDLAGLRRELETTAFKVLAAHSSANPQRSLRTVESLLNIVFSALREGEN